MKCADIYADGGGVRGYWTLLVLAHLMQLIGAREEFDDSLNGHKPAFHSFNPQQYPTHCCHITPTDDEKRIPSNLNYSDKDHSIRKLAKAKRYLPCHYFDYIGGTSTGGCV